MRRAAVLAGLLVLGCEGSGSFGPEPLRPNWNGAVAAVVAVVSCPRPALWYFNVSGEQSELWLTIGPGDVRLRAASGRTIVRWVELNNEAVMVGHGEAVVEVGLYMDGRFAPRCVGQTMSTWGR